LESTESPETTHSRNSYDNAYMGDIGSIVNIPPRL
jgi:hypothetical protein